jgi:hypothetical protein
LETAVREEELKGMGDTFAKKPVIEAVKAETKKQEVHEFNTDNYGFAR